MPKQPVLQMTDPNATPIAAVMPAPLPIEGRIAALRAELNALIDERAAQVLAQNPGQPIQVIKMMLQASAPGCACSQYLNLDRQHRA